MDTGSTPPKASPQMEQQNQKAYGKTTVVNSAYSKTTTLTTSAQPKTYGAPLTNTNNNKGMTGAQQNSRTSPNVGKAKASGIGTNSSGYKKY